MKKLVMGEMECANCGWLSEEADGNEGHCNLPFNERDIWIDEAWKSCGGWKLKEANNGNHT